MRETVRGTYRAVVPGCRFAHPGYGRRSSRGPRVSCLAPGEVAASAFEMCSSLRAKYAEGPVAPEAVGHCLVDPHHRQRFEDASLLEPARVERLEAGFADELTDGAFRRIVVAGDEHDGPSLETMGLRHHVRADLVEGLHHRGAREP